MSINLSIVPVPGVSRSLSDIDRDLAESHRLLRCDAMSVLVQRRDAELFAVQSRICPECGGRLQSKGIGEPVAFVGLAGRFTARLHRLRCVACATTVYPIDAEVDRSSRILPSVSEHLVRFALRAGSFEKGSIEAEFHLGVSVPSSTLHRLVAHEAGFVTDTLAEETTEMLSTGVCPEERVTLGPADTLFLAVDGRGRDIQEQIPTYGSRGLLVGGEREVLLPEGRSSRDQARNAYRRASRRARRRCRLDQDRRARLVARRPLRTGLDSP